MTGYNFNAVLDSHRLTLAPAGVETLWVNITHQCNQSCSHCHVNASPQSTEEMGPSTMDRCLQVLGALDSCKTLDITGGAPELHPRFEYFVVSAREMGKHVVVRHNLTVTRDGDVRRRTQKTHLPSFFAENGVELLVSLPYYEKDLTDGVRGEGVFDKSIGALRRLNSLGYGQADTGLEINIVCNRDGPVSQPERALLEDSFRQELGDRFGIVFNRLLAVTNMPINRYLHQLRKSNAYTGYLDGLTASFDPASVSDLVCRYLVSVGCDGRLYDCDFNQMLGMTIEDDGPMTVFNFDLNALLNRRIRFGPHCFGCTAGGGSH